MRRKGGGHKANGESRNLQSLEEVKNSMNQRNIELNNQLDVANAEIAQLKENLNKVVDYLKRQAQLINTLNFGGETPTNE
jgi:HAMP domain-containing protein